MPIPREIAKTTAADIDSLVAEQATESAYLEFKRDLPVTDNSAKNEFVADVSAFANSSGGDIVYGIDEVDGRAGRIVPFTTDADFEARRLQDILLNNVEPRLPGVQVQAVTVSGGNVMVVRIPQSWAGPHRVKTNQHFYIRDNGRKRQLDVPEIRGLFLRSADQGKQVRDFRTERLGRILAGELPARLVGGSVVVLHLVPADAALNLMSVDPVLYQSERQLPLLSAIGGQSRLNIDGALQVRNVGEDGRAHGYSQFFRNGFFEATKILTSGQSDVSPSLPSYRFEDEVIELLKRFRRELMFLGAGLDLTAMLSLTRANEVRFGVDRNRFDLDDHQGCFDRATLLIPDVQIKGELAGEAALRPLFDLLWQAAGLERSFSYDQNGKWSRR